MVHHPQDQVKLYLDKEQVELDGVIAVNVLVREEEFLPESQHGGLFNALLSETLVRVQPVHWRERGKMEKRKEQVKGKGGGRNWGKERRGWWGGGGGGGGGQTNAK